MVIELLIGMFLGALDAVLEAADLAIPGVPTWFHTGASFSANVYGWLLGFDTWIPVNVALTAAGFVLACWAASMLILLIRVIVSYATFGGGAT